MTRRVTRVHINCDADKCPEWLSFTVAKDGNVNLPIGWLSIGNNLHFCPRCRDEARTKAPQLFTRIREIAEEFRLRVHATDDLKKIHSYVWDVLDSIKPWLGDNYQRDPTVNDMVEQPPPKPGRSLVGPMTRKMFEKVLQEQEEKGLEKYGTRLETQNGRNPVLDAMAELVDAFQYLTQGYMEQQEEVSALEYQEEGVPYL